MQEKLRSNFRLTREMLDDARAAIIELRSSGIASLAEAVRLAKSAHAIGKPIPTVRLTVNEAVHQFLTSPISTSLAAATAKYYCANLEAFTDSYGDANLSDVTFPDLQRWLSRGRAKDGMTTISKATILTRFRVLRRFFRYCQKQNWRIDDPTHELVQREWLPKQTTESIEYLSIEQAKCILETSPNYRHALALALFAGLRPQEIRGEDKPALMWEDVNRVEKTIRIRPELAKGPKGRTLQNLPDNLWSWLEDGPKSGPLLTINSAALQQRIRKVTGIKHWPHDAMRHSFATYHVAAFENLSRTALIMGHASDYKMLTDHYLGIATKAQGTEYFSILPSVTTGNKPRS